MRDWNDPCDLIQVLLQPFNAFSASSLTRHFSLPGTNEQGNAPAHMLACTHSRSRPSLQSVPVPGLHACTHICHLRGDSSGIGL